MPPGGERRTSAGSSTSWSGKRRLGRAPAAGLRRNARTPGGSGPQEKPAENGKYIVQIEGAVQATALWYRKEGQEWHDLYEEQEVYRIVKWQPLPEV